MQSITETEKKTLVCDGCRKTFPLADWAASQFVCPACGRHRPISAYARLSGLLDEGTFQEYDRDVVSIDPLKFPGYEEKLKEQRQKTGLSEAVVTGCGEIGSIPVCVAVLDTRFFMGSLGLAVGEKITRLVEEADQSQLPLIIFSGSGGARVQEGIYSLMQMVKTSGAIRQFSDHGGFFISVLTHPTMGGVTASFAALGDIILAEPGARVGFAGPRVIEETLHVSLPKDFQRSESLEKNGFVDQVVDRRKMRPVIRQLLQLHGY